RVIRGAHVCGGRPPSTREVVMRHPVVSLSAAILVALATIASPLRAQAPPRRTAEQIKASYDAHQGDFDYLLGDWEFTSVSQAFGKGRGYWSAVRVLDQWELVSTEGGTGLQDIGTGHRIGAEMHIEQKFGVMSPNPSIWRIRYYDIGPDRFSWTGDRSTDGGKTWTAKWLQIEARRIGPPRRLGPLAPAKK